MECWKEALARCALHRPDQQAGTLECLGRSCGSGRSNSPHALKSAETIKKIRESIHKMVLDPANIEDRKRRLAAYHQNDSEKVREAREKASESLRARWGVQLHRRYGFKNSGRWQQAMGHRAPTSAAAFFHIHRGCSAYVMIHHRTWRREVAWNKKKKKKEPSVKRPVQTARSVQKMSAEELEVLPRTAVFLCTYAYFWCTLCQNHVTVPWNSVKHQVVWLSGTQGGNQAAQVTGTEATLAGP